MTGDENASLRYEFGKNWSDFASRLPERAIEEAVAGMARLLPREEVRGRTVLDIGCGSGLHSLAALRLGAARVHAIDLDRFSVETARDLLGRHAAGEAWTVEERSVFDMSGLPQYDIVYSWGVLHHTGAMRRAIGEAVARVVPGGLLCLALYRRTPFCAIWRIEKRLYCASPAPVRRLLEAGYVLALRARLAQRGQNFQQHVANYVSARGMDWMTDVRDWLGGYPYESISEEEMMALGAGLSLEAVRRFCQTPGIGVLGSGCDEYVFRRQPSE
ncbi:MAG: class I SAM-dependent methyltransferase [Roseomonas sp.]|jgi:SAM-dependent methyltransferase|nr:class I SAM-dependent methyltransferase [Roseomonas sp.]MCA3430409.1 class I SAM-dependent methyltransferase [Roseomonas sp.]MCA3433812.1 class I SAM-dependent methyltransferase [Roseomonas sp.]